MISALLYRASQLQSSLPWLSISTFCSPKNVSYVSMVFGDIIKDNQSTCFSSSTVSRGRGLHLLLGLLLHSSTQAVGESCRHQDLKALLGIGALGIQPDTFQPEPGQRPHQRAELSSIENQPCNPSPHVSPAPINMDFSSSKTIS